jgi:arginine repressor
MARKKKGASNVNTLTGVELERGAKTRAIKAYYAKNRKAKAKEVVEALKAEGIDVSYNTVSVTKAKLGIRRAKRKAGQAAASQDASAGALANKSAALDAVMLLYKAAKGQDVPRARVTNSFLMLVEMLS